MINAYLQMGKAEEAQVLMRDQVYPLLQESQSQLSDTTQEYFHILDALLLV